MNGTIWEKFSGAVWWVPKAIGWVVPVPNPHPVGLGLHTVLFPGVLLLCGHWFMSYHFGKHLTRQTKSLSCFLILGFDSFFENRQILHKIDPLKSNSKNFLWYATFLIGPLAGAVQPQPSLQLGHVPEIHLFHGDGYYRDMTYHFGKHLMWWTNVWKQIFGLDLCL